MASTRSLPSSQWLLRALIALALAQAAWLQCAAADLLVGVEGRVFRLDPVTGDRKGASICVAPRGFALDWRGHVLVAGDRGIVVVNPAVAGSYESLAVFPSSVSGYATRVVVGSDGDLYVAFQHDVHRFDGATGAYLGKLLGPEELGGWACDGMAVGPDGDLYACDTARKTVRRYKATTGEYLGDLIPPGTPFPSYPGDPAWGPGGDLYILSHGVPKVLRYHGATGALVSAIEMPPDPEGGSLGLSALDPNGTIYAWSTVGNGYARFDLVTGSLLGWVTMGQASAYDRVTGGLVDSGHYPPRRVPLASVSAANSSVVASPVSPIPTDGVSASEVTVTVKDAQGRPAPGVPIVLSAPGAEVVQPDVPTDAQGVARGRVIGTQPGARYLSVFANPGPAYVALSSNIGLTFVPGPAARIAFVKQPGPAVAGRRLLEPVQVQLVDGAGNRIDTTGQAVTLALDPEPTGAYLAGSPGAFMEKGVATFADLSIDRPAAGLRLVASTEGLPSTISEPFDVVPPPTDLLVSSPPNLYRYSLSTRELRKLPSALKYGGVLYGPDGDLWGELSEGGNRLHGLTGEPLGWGISFSRGDFRVVSMPIFGPDGNAYVWTEDWDRGGLYRCHGTLGAKMYRMEGLTEGAQFSRAAFRPDGSLYGVTGASVLRFAGDTGEAQGPFAAATQGSVRCYCFGPDGDLYLVDDQSEAVRRFDGQSGALLGDFVKPDSGGPSGLRSLTFAADGDLYGLTDSGDLARYDGKTGKPKGSVSLGEGEERGSPNSLLSMHYPPPPLPPLPPFDLGRSTWSIAPSSPVANGADSCPITVTLRKPSGYPVPGQPVGLLTTGPGARVEPPVAVTDAQGQAVLNLSSTVPGTSDVDVVWNPGVGQIFLSRPQIHNVTFQEPPPGAPAKLVVELRADTATAGLGGSFELAVTALDAAGKPPRDFHSTVTVALVGGPAGAKLSGTTSKIAGIGGYVPDGAWFNDLTIDAPGDGYALRVSAPGLQPAETPPFSVASRSNWDLAWVEGSGVLRGDGVTGARVASWATAPYGDLAAGPDGQIYAIRDGQGILRLEVGKSPEVFVPAGTGGMDQPGHLAFGPDGNLYVSCDQTAPGSTTTQWSVKRYSGRTGAYLGDLIPSTGSSVSPTLCFGPDGCLYLGFASRIERRHALTGQHLSDLVTLPKRSYGWPLRFTFGPGGALLVANDGQSAASLYDGGTGAYQSTLVPSTWQLYEPITGLVLDPTGDLVLTSVGIWRVRAGSSKLEGPDHRYASRVVTVGPVLPPMPLEHQVDPTASTFTAAPLLDIPADGAAASTLSVHLVDWDGNPLMGEKVAIEVAGEGAVVVQPEDRTNAAGNVTARLTSVVVGEKVATAVVGEGEHRVALPSSCTVTFVAPQPIPSVRRAVFRDASRALGRVTPAAADKMASFFTAAGYRRVSGEQLAAFMRDRITDRQPSVVMMANDVAPDTVAPADDPGRPRAGGLLLDYLRLGGGKVVWPGSYPGQYRAPAGGERQSWHFESDLAPIYAATWPWIAPTPTQITEAGARWGITKAWPSYGASELYGATEVLATVTAEGDPRPRADGWVYGYTFGREGAGLVHILGTFLDASTLDQEAPAQMLRVAEYLPGASPQQLLTVTTVDKVGAPVVEQKVVVSAGGRRVVLRTGGDGTASVAVGAGDYEVSAPDGAGSKTARVTVVAGEAAAATVVVQRWVVVAGQGALTRYDANTCEALDQVLQPGQPYVDEATLAAGPDGTLYVASTKGLYRVKVPSGVVEQVPTYSPGWEPSDVPTSLVVAPDGSLLGSDYRGNAVHRWDPVTGASLGDLVRGGPGETVELDSLAPDGSLLVRRYGRTERINPATGDHLGDLYLAGPQGLTSPGHVLQRPDGAILACLSSSVRLMRGSQSSPTDLIYTHLPEHRDSRLLLLPDGDVCIGGLRLDGDDLTPRGGYAFFDPAKCVFLPAELMPPLWPDAAKSTVQAIPTHDLRADGKSAATLTVWVRNKQGTPMPGVRVSFSTTGLGCILSQATEVTDQDGRIQATLASVVPGTKEVTIALYSRAGQAALAQRPAITFDPNPATRLVSVVSPNGSLLGQPLRRFVLGVTDDLGNAVAVTPTEVSLSLSGGTAGAKLEGAVNPLGSPYGVEFPGLRVDRLGRGYTLVASAAGLAPATSKPFDVTQPTGSELIVLRGDYVSQIDTASGVSLASFPLDSNTVATMGPDRCLYVAGPSQREVTRVDPTTGARLGTFVSAGSHEIGLPLSLTFGPEGDLYLASYRGIDGGLDPERTDEPGIRIKRFDGRTGAKLRDLIAWPDINWADDVDLAFGPDGLLYIARPGLRRVERYDPTTGALLGTPIDETAGLRPAPRRLCFGLDGSLLAIGAEGHEVHRYDVASGASLGAFVPQWSGGLALPKALAMGPDGLLYVSDAGPKSVPPPDGVPFTENDKLARVRRYDGLTGEPLDTLLCSRLGVARALLFAETAPKAPDAGVTLSATPRLAFVRPGHPRGLRLEGWSSDPAHLNFSLLSEPQHSALSGSPPFLTLTPEAGYMGPDELSFEVSQDRRHSSPATVQLQPVVDLPLLSIGNAVVRTGQTAAVTLSITHPFLTAGEVDIVLRPVVLSGSATDLVPVFSRGESSEIARLTEDPANPWHAHLAFSYGAAGPFELLRILLKQTAGEVASRVRLEAASVAINDNDNLTYLDTSRVQSGTIEFTRELRGDANQDGRVNIGDVVLALRVVLGVGGSPGPEVLAAADVDCDGRLTIRDAVMLLRACILGESLKAC